MLHAHGIVTMAEGSSAEGGFDLTALLDWASLLVAILVGLGSSLLTGWVQARRDKRSERDRALVLLLDYERALSDAVANLEAIEYNLEGPVFPDNLDEVRIAAYPHFRCLKLGNDKDQEAYWNLLHPGATDSTHIWDATKAYSKSREAATAMIERLTGTIARRRLVDRLWIRQTRDAAN